MARQKKFKRLKHAEPEALELTDSDLGEEESESDDLKGSGKWEGKSSSRLQQSIHKRKQRSTPLKRTRGRRRSKAGCGQQDDDLDEAMEPLEQRGAVDPPELLIGREFEQYLLDEVCVASQESFIKEADIPERFQLQGLFLGGALSKEDQIKEAHWIYNRAFGSLASPSQQEELSWVTEIDKEQVVQEIAFVLKQLHAEKYEVPFIGMYRYHGCMQLVKRHESCHTDFAFGDTKEDLNPYKALWVIFYLHKKWLLIQKQKVNQCKMWERRVAVVQSCGLVMDELIKGLDEADSEGAVDDLNAKFNLLFPVDGAASAGPYKRPQRQSYYNMCCKAGLRQLVDPLGPTPEQLGENLQNMQKVHPTVDCDLAPEEIDISGISGQFKDIQSALAGARHMAAYELSCEPLVRNYVRCCFSEHAVVTTKPTDKGKLVIDAFHEFACVKYVKAKLVQKFDDGEWLLIQKAEQEELLRVDIELTQDVLDGVLMSGLQASYLSEGSSDVALRWNEQRKLTLKEAFSKMMLPFLVKETRNLLTARAKSWVQAQVNAKLWRIASVAPYSSTVSSDIIVARAPARVLACCWGFRNPPITFVMLDTSGEIMDTLQAGYLNLHGDSTDQQLQRKIDDEERLKKFILQHEPHVVIVEATTHYACRRLKDTVAEVVTRAAEENTALSCVSVFYGEESLPRLYERSHISTKHLPKQTNIIRRAVALGRNLQDPLALIASLCNASEDIVALNLHPMQRFLSTEEVYSVVDQVMSTITNQVGVDVNLAIAHEWMFSPLRFVCGLGIRKASMIQELLQGIRWLPSREYLLRHPFSLKDIVFTNCSGFIRVRQVAHALSGLRKIDLLDDTRIHPDAYELARRLALYAFSKAQSPSKERAFTDDDRDLDLIETAILHIRQTPETLTEEMVIEFSQSDAAIEQVPIQTLQDIRAELICGFRDYRAPYTQPTPDDEFNWLTGEDDVTLAMGKAVHVIIEKVLRHRLMCKLESGIRGVVEKENFSTNPPPDLTNVISAGNSLDCFVAGVMKDQFLVQLTCIGSKLESNCMDDALAEGMTRLIDQVKGGSEKFKPRDIKHVLFQNISSSEAIEVLAQKSSGEVVFHPSIRGPSCLSMTVKCGEDVFVHKEIVEFEKDSMDLATFSKLGKVLKIGWRSFQNLDEVVANYGSPLVGQFKEVLQMEEFHSGTDGDLRRFLEQKKDSCSDDFVYCLSVCPRGPGTIIVLYLVDGNVVQEIVDVHPEGFGFQQKMCRRLGTIVNLLRKAALAPAGEWGAQGKGGYEERSDGSGGRRGGRFGSGQRGRGREGRGGRGSGKWRSDSKEDGFCGFGDAQGGGWEGEADGDNSRGRGRRGGFRGGRGHGRNSDRGGGEGQWGRENSKNGNNWGGDSGGWDAGPNDDKGRSEGAWGAGADVGNGGVWGDATSGGVQVDVGNGDGWGDVANGTAEGDRGGGGNLGGISGGGAEAEGGNGGGWDAGWNDASAETDVGRVGGWGGIMNGGAEAVRGNGGSSGGSTGGRAKADVGGIPGGGAEAEGGNGGGWDAGWNDASAETDVGSVGWGGITSGGAEAVRGNGGSSGGSTGGRANADVGGISGGGAEAEGGNGGGWDAGWNDASAETDVGSVGWGGITSGGAEAVRGNGGSSGGSTGGRAKADVGHGTGWGEVTGGRAKADAGHGTGCGDGTGGRAETDETNDGGWGGITGGRAEADRGNASGWGGVTIGKVEAEVGNGGGRGGVEAGGAEAGKGGWGNLGGGGAEADKGGWGDGGGGGPEADRANGAGWGHVTGGKAKADVENGGGGAEAGGGDGSGWGGESAEADRVNSGGWGVGWNDASTLDNNNDCKSSGWGAEAEGANVDGWGSFRDSRASDSGRGGGQWGKDSGCSSAGWNNEHKMGGWGSEVDGGSSHGPGRRGGFRGGRGRGRGSDNRGRGRGWGQQEGNDRYQDEGDRGRGGRGRWGYQGERGMGRSSWGSWSQDNGNEDDVASRGGGGGWGQEEGNDWFQVEGGRGRVGGRGCWSRGNRGMGRRSWGSWSQGEGTEDDVTSRGRRGGWGHEEGNDQSQDEGGRGRGSKGRWSQGDRGTGRGNWGSWSQGKGTEDHMAGRGGAGGWGHEEGKDRSQDEGRRGRGGRGHWSRGERGTARGTWGSWSKGEGNEDDMASRGGGSGCGWGHEEGNERFQDEGGRGRGGRGQWSRSDGGMGRGSFGSWSHDKSNADDMARGSWSGNEGEWPQSRGNGAGRRGQWSENRESGGFEKNTTGGWDRDSAGETRVIDGSWGSRGGQAAGQKEEHSWGSNSTSKDLPVNAWTRGSELEAVRKSDEILDGWGDPCGNGDKDTPQVQWNVGGRLEDKSMEGIRQEPAVHKIDACLQSDSRGTEGAEEKADSMGRVCDDLIEMDGFLAPELQNTSVPSQSHQEMAEADQQSSLGRFTDSGHCDGSMLGFTQET